jgi:hypothetical protein
MTSSSPSSGERQILSPPGLPLQLFFDVVFLSYGFLLLLFFLSFSFLFRLCTVYRVDGTAAKTVFRFMSLETCGPHPLAREPDIQLDTELSVNLLDVRADVIGDHVVLVLVDLCIRNPEGDTIYLVDWKRWQVTLVSRASCMRHGMGARSARSF